MIGYLGICIRILSLGKLLLLLLLLMNRGTAVPNKVSVTVYRTLSLHNLSPLLRFKFVHKLLSCPKLPTQCI